MLGKIIKLKNIIKFVIINILRIFVGILFSCIVKRNENIFLFSCNPGQKGDLFLHNTKYFFLYLNSQIFDFKTIWLCDNEDIISGLKRYGYKHIYKRYSLKGIYYALRAKYWFTDYNIADTTYSFLAYNAIGINFWHGASGLKKCGLDDPNGNKLIRKNNFISYIYNVLRLKDTYFIVNSNYEIQCRETAFNAKKEQFVLLSSPRLDVLYNDISNAEMFMEEDFNYIKSLKDNGKKIIIYMPTFRETGKDVSDWLYSNNLKNILNKNNLVIICKLHPFDKNNLNTNLNENFYIMESYSDVHPILKLTDAMITDYSGIYFDYLHLDKPIIYHVPDLEEFEKQCRGFYRPYETLTAGKHTKTEEDLFKEILNISNGIDNYKVKRKRLLDEMFIYQDGKNCVRVIEWIRSLNNAKNS